MIDLKPNPKGLLRGEFTDEDGRGCSIQESSNVEEQCIWLGVETDLEGETVFGRMHLSRKAVHTLLPLLRSFVRTGSLGYEDPRETFKVGTPVIGIGEDNRGVEGRVILTASGGITVQEERRSGVEGRMTCAWEVVYLFWEPADPVDPPSRLERLLNDDPE